MGSQSYPFHSRLPGSLEPREKEGGATREKVWDHVSGHPVIHAQRRTEPGGPPFSPGFAYPTFGAMGSAPGSPRVRGVLIPQEERCVESTVPICPSAHPGRERAGYSGVKGEMNRFVGTITGQRREVASSLSLQERSSGNLRGLSRLPPNPGPEFTRELTQLQQASKEGEETIDGEGEVLAPV